ncbi:MAG TPA: substrate-binding domain-containing protein [Terriglobales bacterium]|nr:substrate-binding domain-containing protein [Terriglobales bacterium]
MPKTAPKRLYLIPVLSKALDILELLQTDNRPQSLESIYEKTSISKTTVYRILKTLVHRGYLAQTQDGLYRVVSRPRKIRFGFGSESSEMPFSVDVTDSLKAAAASAGVDLLVLDNRYDAATALENADEFVRQRVDLVIEFQIDEHVAPMIADKIHGAGIPLIAVDIPHPHATYFGVNNYRVGFEAGEFLAQHAKSAWGGAAKWVLGLGITEAGPLVQSRITGAFAGVRSKLPRLPEDALLSLDGEGLHEKSYRLVRDFLRKHPHDRGILVAAATDTSALGALQAVRELSRERQVAIVGQDCIQEALDGMSVPGTPLIASVSHEANSYGPRLIHIGLALLNGQTVPPYNYVEHKLVTASSLVKRSRAVPGRSRSSPVAELPTLSR